MSKVTLQPSDSYGYGFIPPEFLLPGEDEYWQRNRQAGTGRAWRALKTHELELLIKNGNYCSNWDHFLVTDPFEPILIRNSNFYGLVRLGVMEKTLLKHNDYCIPAGIRNSTIISCDIGNDSSIQDCANISHYIIGDQVILARIDEMQTTNHAKFGNGVVMEGEAEEIRIEIEVMNEAGGRGILPFADMLPADAFLWAAYRDDQGLMEKLKTITQENYGSRRGSYGVIGNESVIKSSKIIKDVLVGNCAYIKGANKLKNLTILSSEDEPTQIGEGVEMVNGIVGYGCNAFYGVKAIRFVMGRNCNLKYGARLVHSVLGDNSTVSCCEILNNLVFPVHEQHHNNSFLIASLIQGMSNMAAGATIGSNHNSRANDGEIRAGRGFWPGLSVTLKHPSCFASYIIIAKGDFPYELNITLPFSLLNNNASKDQLEIMPAYFWMYNLYALERNSWKAEIRDKRKIRAQKIETDYLAPDTAEEIVHALNQLEIWLNRAGVDFSDQTNPEDDLAFLSEDPEIPAEGLEKPRRKTMILKPKRARRAYRQMLRFYADKTFFNYFMSGTNPGFKDFLKDISWPDETGNENIRDWVNLGGQIVPAFRLDKLRKDIREGRISSWTEIHAAYRDMANTYNQDRARHAWKIMEYLKGKNPLPGPAALDEEMDWFIRQQQWITEQVYESRAKDYNDPFRCISYRNKEEMEAVAGNAADNSFVKFMKKRCLDIESEVKALKIRLNMA